jgi:hypothetical protein
MSAKLVSSHSSLAPPQPRHPDRPCRASGGGKADPWSAFPLALTRSQARPPQDRRQPGSSSQRRAVAQAPMVICATAHALITVPLVLGWRRNSPAELAVAVWVHRTLGRRPARAHRGCIHTPDASRNGRSSPVNYVLASRLSGIPGPEREFVQTHHAQGVAEGR